LGEKQRKREKVERKRKGVTGISLRAAGGDGEKNILGEVKERRFGGRGHAEVIKRKRCKKKRGENT